MRLLFTVAAIALSPAALLAQQVDPAGKILGQELIGAEFGSAVALSEGLAVVGAPTPDGSRRGEAFVFDAQTGARLRALTPSERAQDDRFGSAVAMSGTRALVAAPSALALPASGAAFLFDAETGDQLARFTGSSQDTGFGAAVALTRDAALVGVTGQGDPSSLTGERRGAVAVFDAATGAATTNLIARDNERFDLFGATVAADGDAVVVGAPGDGDQRGSAYFHDLATVNPTREATFEERKLTALDGESLDLFGQAVAVDGATALVGAPGDDASAGSAYLFDLATGAQLRKLVADDREAGDNFGFSVALNDGFAFVGAQGDDDAGPNAGAVYLFEAASGAQIAKLTAGDAADGDEFGRPVALDGNTALIGARLADQGALPDDSGAVYLTALAPEWTAFFGGDYDDAANWSGLAPSEVDGFDVTISPDFDQTIVGPEGPDSVGAFALGFGEGKATLALQRGGGIIASDDFDIGPNGVLTGSGGVITTGFAFINNQGVIDFSEGLGLDPGSLLSNSGTLTGGGAVPSLFNDADGTVFAAAGTTMTFTEQAFNRGRIVGGDATLIFEDPNGLSNEGAFDISGERTDVFGRVVNGRSGEIVNSGGGTLTFFDDLVNLGVLRTARDSATVVFGEFSGDGSTSGLGTLFLEGRVSTGASPALVNFTDTVLGETSTTIMELAGTIRGGEYDAWDVDGDLTLDGALSLVNLNGFVPDIGDRFNLFMATGGIFGDFDSIELSPLAQGGLWREFRTDTTYGFEVAPVPLPAAAWMLLSGIGALAALRRGRRA